ncbi:MAG: type IV pilus modification PilV family protein [Phycisphaerae bacterium]
MMQNLQQSDFPFTIASGLPGVTSRSGWCAVILSSSERRHPACNRRQIQGECATSLTQSHGDTERLFKTTLFTAKARRREEEKFTTKSKNHKENGVHQERHNITNWVARKIFNNQLNWRGSGKKNLSALSVPSVAKNHSRSGFSMIEILFAIAILALGLLMIAAVFPVAIKWTQQDANKTIGQVIARNAIAIIQTKYSGGSISSVLQSEASAQRYTLQPFPGITTSAYGNGLNQLTLNDRTYAFGSYSPYPTVAINPAISSHYYWTAIMRMSPSQPPTGTSCDIYILVFYKGDYTYTYTTSGTPTPLTSASAPGARGSGDGNAIPYVAQGSLANAAFPIGAIGIDYSTGAVFRKIVNANTGAIVRSDGGSTSDTVLYCPPADGATASPLIYVYTTTVTF